MYAGSRQAKTDTIEGRTAHIIVHAAIPDEISRHVEAVLVLSKREILLRLLREAERCIGLDEVAAAAILAGIALEELCLLNDPSILRQHGSNVELWRELRNRAAQRASGPQKLEPEAVAAMLTGIRTLLDQAGALRNRQTPDLDLDEFENIRGKYAFVPSSVDDFLKRKHEDLEQEDLE